MDGDKVEAVASWPKSRSARGVRSFLGLAGYYHKFIHDFGSIAAPLTRLLRKEAFAWTPEAAEAFTALKLALSTGPVLQMPDFSRQFIVDCDASGTGFGAVLHQGEGPLAFFSQPFAARHSKLASYERELIGLVQAVRHWRPYLWGRRFLVRTDHYSLKFILDQRLSTVSQHQWLSKLFGFDFAVEYRPERLNSVAGALSRRDEDASDKPRALAISGPTFAFSTSCGRPPSRTPRLAASRSASRPASWGHPGAWPMVFSSTAHAFLSPTMRLVHACPGPDPCGGS
jgi:hypothetical protein